MGRHKISPELKSKNRSIALTDAQYEQLKTLDPRQSATRGIKNLMHLMTTLYNEGKFSSEDVKRILEEG